MRTFRIVTAIFTLLCALGTFALAIMGFMLMKIGLSICCLSIAGVLGYFCYTDYKYLWGKKEEDLPPTKKEIP